jgi:CNT family concentrative nucleoside transporter
VLTSGVLGVLALLAVATFASEARAMINPGLVTRTLALQAAIAFVALTTSVGQGILGVMTAGAQNIIAYTDVGIAFVFGELGDPDAMFVFAFRVLPVIVFVSSLVGVLYYLRIMQVIIRAIGYVLRTITGASKLETVSAAANIFIGIVESPMTIKPWLHTLTRSQLFSVMCVSLSSVSGSILVGYSSLGVSLEYLLPAAFMSAPGGLLMAKILIPETASPIEPDARELAQASFGDTRPVNIVEAASDGAAAGLKLAVNVGAMLIAFVALVALINGLLGGIGGLIGYPHITLEFFLGYIFAPLAFLIGIPWEEAMAAGALLGEKVILNEFLAFASFAEIKDTFSPHSQTVITFALCGFANLGSMAIIMGGLGGLVPTRKSDIAELGFKAVLAGTLANLMSAALASVFLTMG